MKVKRKSTFHLKVTQMSKYGTYMWSRSFKLNVKNRKEILSKIKKFVKEINK